jgi:hypothetical protein
MKLYAAINGILGLFLLFFGFIFFLRRSFSAYRKRLGRSQPGFYPDTGSLGNALHALQAIVQTRAEHVIAQQLNEEAEEDDDTGPDHAIRHLHRQALKIRRGEEIHHLTTYLER